MDAYAINARFFPINGNQILIHLLLPDMFLSYYDIDSNGDYMFSVAIYSAIDQTLTKYVPTAASFFTNNGEKELPYCAWGLCTSVPVMVDTSPRYLDVVHFKVYDKKKHNLKIIKLSVFNAIFPLICHPRPTESSKHVGDRFGELCASLTQTQAPSNASPADFIMSLIEKTRDTQHKHHTALEEPGLVRVKPENSNQLMPSHEAKITIKKATSLKRGTFIRREHVMSANCYHVFVPDTSNKKYEPLLSMFQESLSSPNIPQVDVSLSFVGEALFFKKITDRFLTSLQDEIQRNPQSICQEFPIHISMGATLDCVKYIAYRTLMLLGCFTEQCPAWFLAHRLKKTTPRGAWADVLDMSFCGLNRGECGVFLGETSTVPVTRVELFCILTKRGWFQTPLSCVVVFTDLSAWVVLPGGFAIKGRYLLEEEDIQYICTHYGQQR
ncbi:viral DNA cleavage/packaging protein [Cricetid gammaherpesvirus 2]|uniref:Viral DNA cleavage/packaging protein n=1 Tax=Cricetid gammaherpesvirus 2 TaxID=1605972 RepID=E9M5L5_9GAMA|nr:viral DNA cleavage/packaging protein [Cricetid gammaherpesvirus 2]ADW24373.1 viral DNA cleavage/packaging protein [Cricetid gammaherpesvirus 2]ADW24455.1 viral DNA cleavage/packaging protein [Cricetid gammaherpesvirus 2]